MKKLSKLCSTFLVGKEENRCFRYLGLHLIQEQGHITLDQNHYTSSLKPITFDQIHEPADSSLTEVDKDNLRKVTGQLLWVAGQTRPD